MRRGLAATLLLLAACGPSDAPATGAAPPAASAPAPLAGQDCLIILLDALHAAHLGCYGGPPDVAPNIDALAAQSVRCAQARSNSSWTLPSTTTLFTGLFQETHGLHFDVDFEQIRLDEAVDTLAELFRASGYDTAYLNQNPFSGEDYGLSQGFDSYLEFNEFRQTPDAIVDAAVQRLSAPSDKPRFTYVHLRKPHTPFDAPAEERALFADPQYAGPADGSEAQISDHNSGKQRLDPDDLRHHEDLYEANIHQVDGWLPRLLGAVDAQRTLVVLLSDHGEAVGQHAVLGHNWNSWEEFVRIPLILRHPAFGAGRVLEQRVGTVDLLPTLQELFGLRAAGQTVQGRSFAPLLLQLPGWEERPVFTSSRLLRGKHDLAVIDGEWKYIRTEPGGREQLYDLSNDPGERKNLVKEAPPGVLERLRGLLVAWAGAQQRRYAVPSDGLDDATLERLRQLGYIK
jgi:arylsulfatase A-like enzyme